jgi:S-adenosylmethionine uptake transporter
MSTSLPERAAAGPSTHAKGIFWMLVGTLVFSVMPITVREATQHMHAFEAAFFRNLVALAIMFPWLASTGFAALKTARWRLYTSRALTGAVSMFCWFYGMSHMPMGSAQALSFTQPLFATVLAALILREDVRLRRWSATVLGFVGVLIIIQPGSQPVGVPEMAVLTSAFFGAISAVQVKSLSRTESTSAMVTFLALYMTPLSLIPALFVWTWPPMEAWFWIVAMGVVGTAGNLCVVRAYHLAEASALMTYDYIRLPLAAIFGWAIYNEALTATFWIGASIIRAAPADRRRCMKGRSAAGR